MNRDHAVSSRLFLVGTSHRDPQGLQRCCRLLQALDPHVVLVEVSPFAVRLRRKHGRFLLKLLLKSLKRAAVMIRIPVAVALRSPLIKPILRQCALPFEYRAAQRRFQLKGTPVFCVDAEETSRLFMADWPELLSSANLARLLKGGLPLPVSAAEEYAQAHRALARAKPSTQHPLGYGDFSLWQRREQWLEKTVRATLAQLRPGRLVYLGGWRHVVPNAGQSLYDRLRDLAPWPFLLDQADETAPDDFDPQPRGHEGGGCALP